MLANMVYQARAGDGFKRKGLKRKNSYFNTPQEAVSEALALKEKIDSKYKNKIKWNYSKRLSGTAKDLKILKGYLNGDETSSAFFLQILTLKPQKDFSIVRPKKPSKVSKKDQTLSTKIISILS